MSRLALSAATLIALTIPSMGAYAAETEPTGMVDDVELTYFYPFTTSYRQVDPGYAFDADPLTAYVEEPYLMPLVVQHVPVRRSLVKPRISFVEEVAEIGDVL